MRAAILHLAFAGLGAAWCETFAWEDNASSLGVTERLGYEPNGVEMDLRRGEGRPLRRFRMTREAWEAQRRRDIRIEGLEHCLDLFGLPQAVAGADACRGGWCVVTLPVEGDATVEVIDRFTKVAARQAKGRLGAVGVDIPIGLSDGPPRKCDVDARALLGDRRSSVFPAPVRPVLGARSYEAGAGPLPGGQRGRPVQAGLEPRAQDHRGGPPARPDPPGPHLRVPPRGRLRRPPRRPDGPSQEGPAGSGRAPGRPPSPRAGDRRPRGQAAARAPRPTTSSTPPSSPSRPRPCSPARSVASASAATTPRASSWRSSSPSPATPPSPLLAPLSAARTTETGARTAVTGPRRGGGVTWWYRLRVTGPEVVVRSGRHRPGGGACNG